MSSSAPTLSGSELDVSFNFEVRAVEDGEVGNFLSVEGLERTVEPYEHKEGGRNGMVHYLVGQAQYSDLVLRWGWMRLSWLYDWAKQVEFGRKFRKNLIITQMDRGTEAIRVYSVIGAWPISWTGAKLDGMSSEIPIEEVKLKYQKLDLDVVGSSTARGR